VSNLPEIKERLDRLTKLSNKMKDQFKRFSGPEGKELKKNAKKKGAGVGIGVGVSFFGLIVACVASLYILAVIILAVNAALNRPWLSALIVVGGFLLIGGGVLAVGVGIAKSNAKELSKSTEGLTKDLKTAGEEMKTEVDELQKMLKAEAEARQKQVADMVAQAKAAAPVVAPAALGALLVMKWMKKRRRARKERKSILKVIDTYEENRAKE